MFVAGALALSGCGGEAPAPAGPAVPATPVPTVTELPAPYNEANVEAGKKLFGRQCAPPAIISLLARGILWAPTWAGVFERHRQGRGVQHLFARAEEFRTRDVDAGTGRPVAAEAAGLVPGTGMFFNGIKSPEERRDLISYLLIESRRN